MWANYTCGPGFLIMFGIVSGSWGSYKFQQTNRFKPSKGMTPHITLIIQDLLNELRIWFEKPQMFHVHPGRLTWNLRIHPWKRRNIFQTSKPSFSGSMLILGGVWNIYLHESWKMAKNFEVTNPYKSLTVIKQPPWIFQLHPMPRETRNSRTAFVFSFGAEKKFSAQFSWWSIFIDPVWRLLVYSLYSSSSFCCSYAILCVDLDCTETMILPCLNLIAGLRAVKPLTRMILGKKHHRINLRSTPGQIFVGRFEVTISNWHHLNDSKNNLNIRSTIN